MLPHNLQDIILDGSIDTILPHDWDGVIITEQSATIPSKRKHIILRDIADGDIISSLSLISSRETNIILVLQSLSLSHIATRLDIIQTTNIKLTVINCNIGRRGYIHKGSGEYDDIATFLKLGGSVFEPFDETSMVAAIDYPNRLKLIRLTPSILPQEGFEQGRSPSVSDTAVIIHPAPTQTVIISGSMTETVFSQTIQSIEDDNDTDIIPVNSLSQSSIFTVRHYDCEPSRELIGSIQQTGSVIIITAGGSDIIAHNIKKTCSTHAIEYQIQTPTLYVPTQIDLNYEQLVW